MYSKNILAKFQTLRNAGIMKNAYLTAEIKNEDETKIIRVYLDIEDGVIKNTQFKCFGGVLLTVCVDELCNLMINKNINEISEISVSDLLLKIGEVEDIETLQFTLSIIDEILKEYNKILEKEAKKNNQ